MKLLAKIISRFCIISAGAAIVLALFVMVTGVLGIEVEAEGKNLYFYDTAFTGNISEGDSILYKYVAYEDSEIDLEEEVETTTTYYDITSGVVASVSGSYISREYEVYDGAETITVQSDMVIGKELASIRGAGRVYQKAADTLSGIFTNATATTADLKASLVCFIAFAFCGIVTIVVSEMPVCGKRGA